MNTIVESLGCTPEIAITWCINYTSIIIFLILASHTQGLAKSHFASPTSLHRYIRVSLGLIEGGPGIIH